jgi:hypothetical protein
MTKLVLVFAVLLLATPLTGCLAVATPAMGTLYTDVKGPLDAEGSVSGKTGESCATSYLGLVATGDASLQAAAAAGGIKNVTAADHHTTNILGLIGTFCTIAYGS